MQSVAHDPYSPHVASDAPFEVEPPHDPPTPEQESEPEQQSEPDPSPELSDEEKIAAKLAELDAARKK